MYRIPENLDLSKAVGEFVTQIRVGKYDIQFELGDIHFLIQSPIKISKENNLVNAWEEGTWPNNVFLEIFNVPVIAIQVPDERTITLKFENGLELYLCDNSDQYECLEITISGEGESWII